MGIFHEIEYHFCAKKSCNWLVVVVVDVCIDTIIDMCVMKSKKYHEKRENTVSKNWLSANMILSYLVSS